MKLVGGAARAAPSPDALPPELLSRYGEVERVARSAPEAPFVIVTANHVAYVGHDARTARLAREECERLVWADGQRIPVPRLVERAEAFFVVNRVRRDPPAGAIYVEAVVEAAERISRADPPLLHERAGIRSSPLRTKPVRAIKLAAARLNAQEFLKLRAAWTSLPRDALSHGDFHPNNVLFDRDGETVNVIDWTHLGYQPRHSDLLLLWTQLRDEVDRQRIFNSVLQREDDLAHVATVHHWLAIRSFVELATDVPMRAWDRARLTNARQLIDEARVNASKLRARR